MRILLTGHLGYIGAALAPLLLTHGHQVVGLDSGLFVAGAGNRQSATPVDIRDIQPDHLRGFDAIVHLAALTGDILDIVPAALITEINYSTVIRLASLAKYAGVSRFIYPSSCSVYPRRGTGPLTERSLPSPQDPDSVLKLRVERDLMRLAGVHFSPIIMRLGTVCGVGAAMRHDVPLHWLIARHLSGARVAPEMIPSGPHRLIHLEDTARALLGILEAPLSITGQQVFNVVLPGEGLSRRELGALVDVELEDDATPGQATIVEATKLRNSLPGFSFEWDVPHIVEQVRQAYQSSKLDSGTLQRLHLLRKLALQAQRDQGQLHSANLRPAPSASAVNPMDY